MIDNSFGGLEPAPVPEAGCRVSFRIQERLRRRDGAGRRRCRRGGLAAPRRDGPGSPAGGYCRAPAGGIPGRVPPGCALRAAGARCFTRLYGRGADLAHAGDYGGHLRVQRAERLRAARCPGGPTAGRTGGPRIAGLVPGLPGVPKARRPLHGRLRLPRARAVRGFARRPHRTRLGPCRHVLLFRYFGRASLARPLLRTGRRPAGARAARGGQPPVLAGPPGLGRQRHR